MISRILSTTVLVLLSAGAFLSQIIFAERSDRFLFLSFGVLSLLLAVLNWFAWGTIREGWDYGRKPGKAGAALPVSASLWPVYIAGVMNLFSGTGSQRPKPGASGTDGNGRL